VFQNPLHPRMGIFLEHTVGQFLRSRDYGGRHSASRGALPLSLGEDLAPITSPYDFVRRVLLTAALTNGGWTLVYIAPEPPKSPAPVIPLHASDHRGRKA
jgi:hypothetical protein